jgi:taurine dioxygenase
MPLRAEPLHPTFGARIHGLSPLVPVESPIWDEWRDAFAEHRLLVVSLPGLTDEEHLRLLGALGPIATEGIDEPRAIGWVSNVRPDGALAGTAASWHCDYFFFPHPYEAISLYAVELPPAGTQTWFVDGQAAAADLPAELRGRVEGRAARHAVDVATPEREAVVRVRKGRLDESYPHSLRPVLWPHRATARPILAITEQQTDAIVGLDPGASTALIEELFAHLYRDDHVYVHEWSPGELVVWDNHALQHARPEVGTEEARTLRRVCVGERQDLSVFAYGYAGRPTAAETP